MSLDNFKDDLMDILKKGESEPIQLAKRFNMPVQRIYDWMDEYGIDTVKPKQDAVIAMVKEEPDRLKEIAEEAGFSEDTVKGWVKEIREYKKYSDSIRKEAVDMFKAGFAKKEICEALNIVQTTLYSWLKDEGQTKEVALRKENVAKAIEMIKEGKSATEIADTLNVPRQFVYNVSARKAQGLRLNKVKKSYIKGSVREAIWKDVMENEMTRAEAAERHGVGQSSVTRIIQEKKLDNLKHEENEMKPMSQHVKELLQKGKSTDEICDASGATKQYVWNIKSILKREGVAVMNNKRGPHSIDPKIMKAALNEYFASGKTVAERAQIAASNGISAISLYRKIKLDKRYKPSYVPRAPYGSREPKVQSEKIVTASVPKVTSTSNTLEQELRLARLEAENAVLKKYLEQRNK